MLCGFLFPYLIHFHPPTLSHSDLIAQSRQRLFGHHPLVFKRCGLTADQRGEQGQSLHAWVNSNFSSARPTMLVQRPYAPSMSLTPLSCSVPTFWITWEGVFFPLSRLLTRKLACTYRLSRKPRHTKTHPAKTTYPSKPFNQSIMFVCPKLNGVNPATE